MRLEVGDQQRQQALDGERVRFGGVAQPQVRLARLRQLVLREQLFGVGERARPFEREQQLFVGRSRRRQTTRREAQPHALRRQAGFSEPRLIERGHLVATRNGRVLDQLGQHARREPVGAAPFDVGQHAERLHGLADERAQPRRRRGAERIEADIKEVDGQPLAVAIEGHLEGDGRALRAAQPRLHLEVPGAEVQPHVVQLGQLRRRGAHFALQHLGVDEELEEAEVELLLLVLRRAAREVHREGHVGNGKSEVGDDDARRQLQLGEADEGTTVHQPKLGADDFRGAGRFLLCHGRCGCETVPPAASPRNFSVNRRDRRRAGRAGPAAPTRRR